MNQPELIERFRFEEVREREREWLRDTTNDLRTHIKASAKTAVKIGLSLLDARKRLPHGQFSRWVRSELPWSISKVKRFIQTARVFPESQQLEGLSASTLYVLCGADVPPSARREALEMVKDGHTVTADTAREILRLHRPTIAIDQQTASARQTYRRERESRNHENEKFAEDAQNWRNLQKAIQKFEIIHISKASDDEEGDTTISITAFKGGERPVTVNRNELYSATAVLAEVEPTKTCKRCRLVKPLINFSLDKRVKDGRNRYCRGCESTRRLARIAAATA